MTHRLRCVNIISTHALTEGDTHRSLRLKRTSSFQLTPSRRATGSLMLGFPASSFQLTPSRRATVSSVGTQNSKAISTHALTEGDYKRIHEYQHIADFNSRPHGGRRRELLHILIRYSDFNSRPHGGRQKLPRYVDARPQFQLTPSRRATEKNITTVRDEDISTHALTEGDPFAPIEGDRAVFQLTPSRRATVIEAVQTDAYDISTHALTEGDDKALKVEFPERTFQLTPSRRATEEWLSKLKNGKDFNSRPHGGRRS